MHRMLLAAGALAAIAANLEAQTPAPSAAACEALKALQLPGVTLTVTKAQWIAAGTAPPRGPGGPAAAAKLPAYCRIDGVIDRRTGAGGAAYGIGFAVSLPDTWNGRYLLQGGGGLNGSVQPPIGAVAAGNDPALARGFAVASTDTGHEGRGGFDAGFMRDQQAAIDFQYAAIGRVAEIARRIVAQYYGKPPDHSYFSGCSTGGREAMLMAERYPTYFDGIVAGAPAMRTSFSGIGDRWVAATLNEIAPKNEKGQPLTKNALSESDKKAVIDGLLKACDAADGVNDGMIFDWQACRFDPKSLMCSGAKQDGCLSPAQAATLDKAFAGPKDSKGRQVYPGFPFDTGIVSTQGIPGLLHGGASPVGPAFTDIGMDVDAAAERAMADPAASLGETSRWTNLNTFSSHGGKLIFWHGLSDPWFSPLDTVDYYKRMAEANGGAHQVRQWSRLFLSPGMGHCGGGPAALDSFDALSAIVRWVEQDVPPESLTATGRAFPGRSGPLCAYPLHAQYKGQRDPEDAANFACCTLLVAVFLLYVPASAQVIYGTIVGTITDAGGGAVPGATVKITSLDTNDSRTTSASAAGTFSVPNLAPGRYRVEVQQPGFKQFVRSGVQVQVDVTARVDISLEVGDVSQSVEVTSEAPLLQADTASLGSMGRSRPFKASPSAAATSTTC